MKVCPNCSRKVNGSGEYCNRCGSRLDGSAVGDFSTHIPFVFRHPQEYVFVNSLRGRQVIITSESLEGLEEKVRSRGFIWCGDTGVVETAVSENAEPADTVFLKASRLEQSEVTSSDESESFREELARRWQNRDAGKKPDILKKEISPEDLDRSYGILSVSREYVRGKLMWVYRSAEMAGSIRQPTLSRLKNAVTSAGLDFEIVDSNMARETFIEDMEEVKRRDAEILAKRDKSKAIDVRQKSKITKKVLGYSAGNSTELDRMFR